MDSNTLPEITMVKVDSEEVDPTTTEEHPALIIPNNSQISLSHK